MIIRELAEDAIKQYTETLLGPRHNFVSTGTSLYNIIFSAIQAGMSDAYTRGEASGKSIAKNDVEHLLNELQVLEMKQDVESHARIAEKYGLHHYMHDLSTWKGTKP